MPAHSPDAADLERLRAEGYFSRTGWLAAPVAARAAAAVRLLSGFEPAGVGRSGDRRLERAVRSDERVWIDPAAPPEGLLPVLDALEALRVRLGQGMMLGLGRTELQLARFPGNGACYLRHLDSFRGKQGRRVTAIYFLNPDWQPAHGGRLRLYPPGQAPLELAPVLDTLVAFLSEEVEHEVLPSFAERYALTAWWSGP